MSSLDLTTRVLQLLVQQARNMNPKSNEFVCRKEEFEEEKTAELITTNPTW